MSEPWHLSCEYEGPEGPLLYEVWLPDEASWLIAQVHLMAQRQYRKFTATRGDGPARYGHPARAVRGDAWKTCTCEEPA